MSVVADPDVGIHGPSNAVAGGGEEQIVVNAVVEQRVECAADRVRSSGASVPFAIEVADRFAILSPSVERMKLSWHTVIDSRAGDRAVCSGRIHAAVGQYSPVARPAP